jgi:two-component system KDP operon response regulator KdpE
MMVEDELAIRRFVRSALRAHGYVPIEVESGREALAVAASRHPDLVLLDLGLPDLDGLEVTKQLRAFCRAPIIVLSARGNEQDKVAALDQGADDYLTKPFGVAELLARMRAALRHAEGRVSEFDTQVVTAGEVHINVTEREVLRGGERVPLTGTEFRLLAALARQAGQVVTHAQLLRAVWGDKYAGQTAYLHVHLAHLRAKLEAMPARPRLLLTEPGVGYRLKTD